MQCSVRCNERGTPINRWVCGTCAQALAPDESRYVDGPQRRAYVYVMWYGSPRDYACAMLATSVIVSIPIVRPSGPRLLPTAHRGGCPLGTGPLVMASGRRRNDGTPRFARVTAAPSHT